MNSEGQAPPEESKPRTAASDEGSVYYLRIGDRVKIGHTTHLFKRLATYPPNTEILLIRSGSRELEHQEHLRFGEHRADGREWFVANDRVLEMIAAITTGVDREWEPEWFQRRSHQPQAVTHRMMEVHDGD